MRILACFFLDVPLACQQAVDAGASFSQFNSSCAVQNNACTPFCQSFFTAYTIRDLNNNSIMEEEEFREVAKEVTIL